jgi:GNAT superfamily N-acetyltransferase
MAEYRIRIARLDDVEALVHHRIAMFEDMGTPIDSETVARSFREWVTRMLQAGTYHGWLVETAAGEIVAGGGATVVPWPPGPGSSGDRLAFVYNVYTEPPHRRRGLARRLMGAIHAWCRESGIAAAALNSSDEGRPLYESIGYQVRANPMMICELLPDRAAPPSPHPSDAPAPEPLAAASGPGPPIPSKV